VREVRADVHEIQHSVEIVTTSEEGGNASR
jgi:hypothetical protein